MVERALQRLNPPLGTAAPIAIGLMVALALLVAPAGLVGSLVMDSGLPALLPAAEPPLGPTARTLLALQGGGAAGAFTWLVLMLLLGEDKTIRRTDRPMQLGEFVPVLRRADAHPDAPPRPPVLATRDLGTPFLDVRAPVEPQATDAPQPIKIAAERPLGPPLEQSLPVDFNQPLAAFDPSAILDDPLPAPLPIPPLRHGQRPQTFAPTERFETFELRPPVAPEPREEAITRPETQASIHALLERLERGVAPARAKPREPSQAGLENTLAALRQMAVRA